MNLLNTIYQNIVSHAPLIDQDGCFPEQEFTWLADASLLQITLPGQLLDFTRGNTPTLLQLLKNVGRASLPVGRIYEGHINALYLIHLYATSEQQKRWYTDVSQHHQLFGVWNTQAQDGIRIHDLGSGRYRLEGCKTFCSGGSHVTRPLITGELVSPDKKGWQMCIIPTEKVKIIVEDRSFWKPLGMKASASFKMDFTGIEISEEDLLGPPNAYYQQPYFSGGAIRFAAVQLGGAEAVMEEMHHFITMMNRTQDPFQQARMAEITYLTESGNLWINQAGAKTDEWLQSDDRTDQILAYANMTRTMIEEICLRTLQLAERSVGSRGLMRPDRLERVHRDLTTYLRQPAPDATLTAIGAYVFNQPATHDIWN
ncbi:acyl-CoA dehydrogenase family protein [Mucilaginibacter robiniae]|uniref:acyl-CoA dehydrogenase family protein n=1 Tax=Mucilaginibacter robiniae TaxID=2728022 RepID=UPI002006E996|nr:acyl-CoA dehydrogenase family protein [Mucilaginibacter robiniae]